MDIVEVYQTVPYVKLLEGEETGRRLPAEPAAAPKHACNRRAISFVRPEPRASLPVVDLAS